MDLVKLAIDIIFATLLQNLLLDIARRLRGPYSEIVIFFAIFFGPGVAPWPHNDLRFYLRGSHLLVVFMCFPPPLVSGVWHRPDLFIRLLLADFKLRLLIFKLRLALFRLNLEILKLKLSVFKTTFMLKLAIFILPRLIAYIEVLNMMARRVGGLIANARFGY